MRQGPRQSQMRLRLVQGARLHLLVVQGLLRLRRQWQRVQRQRQTLTSPAAAMVLEDQAAVCLAQAPGEPFGAHLGRMRRTGPPLQRSWRRCAAQHRRVGEAGSAISVRPQFERRTKALDAFAGSHMSYRQCYASSHFSFRIFPASMDITSSLGAAPLNSTMRTV